MDQATLLAVSDHVSTVKLAPEASVNLDCMFSFFPLKAQICMLYIFVTFIF